MSDSCDSMDYSPSALLSIEFSRLDWVTIFFFSSPGDLPDPGNQPRSPALQKDTLTTEPPGLSRTNTKKTKKKRERERCPFHHRGLERKSRGQVWTWNTNEASKINTILPREHTGHSKHPLPTTQEMILHMDITRWSLPKSDWLYSLQPKLRILFTVSKNKTWSWLWLRSSFSFGKIQA